MKSRLRNARIAIAALASMIMGGTANAATNLFTNGSFETGNFSGWTVVNQNFTGTPEVRGSVGGIAPEDGRYQAVLTGSARQISQTVKDTAGENISFSFWYAGEVDDGTFTVIVNGAKYPVLPRSPTYQEFAFTFGFTATGSETIEIDTDFNDTASDLLVDNFSIVPNVGLSPVPEASTWVMTLAGFSALGLANWRVRRRNAPPAKHESS
jgi:hypothetical protein